MKKLVLTALMICVLVSTASFADRIHPGFNIQGKRLTDFEMRQLSGSLFVIGIFVSNEIQKADNKQNCVDPDKEHCDIIAQNQADDLGLDTRDQSGSYRDYNEILVDEIYDGYPSGRSSEPEEGTSGYYFTSSGDDMEHMGTYSRTAGSTTYTRNTNRSYDDTVRSYTVSVGYKPPRVKSQKFIALPRIPFLERLFR